jgi:hypothetical protein
MTPALPSGSLSSRVIGQYQRIVDASAPLVVNNFNQGRIVVPAGVDARTVLGGRLDKYSRDALRDWLGAQGIAEGRGQDVMVNRRVYMPGPVQEGEPFYRIPDLRFPNEAVTVDLTIGRKTPTTPQVQDFQKATATTARPQGDDVLIVGPSRGPLRPR